MIKKVEKAWGREEWIVNEPEYCGKVLTLKPDHRCSLHFHKNKKETFYIVKGEMALLLYNFKKHKLTTRILKPGDTFTIHPPTPHTFMTYTDEECRFIEFSTHHEDEDSYRLIDSK